MTRAIRRNLIPILVGTLLLAGLLAGVLTSSPFRASNAANGYGYNCSGGYGYGYTCGGGGGGAGTTTTSTTAPGANETRQIGGIDRIQTAILLSQDTFGNAPASGQASAAGQLQLTAGAVVLAREDIFPDALAGTPFAVAKKAPLLLTYTSTLVPSVRDEIHRVLNRGGTVYLLGGTDALAPSVASTLNADGYNVQRFNGIDRYETAIKIADTGLGNPGTVFLASGVNFPDALCGGAAGGKVGAAVLLSQGLDPNARTTAYLNAHTGTTRYSLGGPAARAYPNATPIVGIDRYETCTKVATQFFTSPTVAGVASGEKFPDALSGGTHIGLRGGPLVLTLPTSLPNPTKDYLTANSANIDEAIIYGGALAVNAQARDEINKAVTANG